MSQRTRRPAPRRANPRPTPAARPQRKGGLLNRVNRADRAQLVFAVLSSLVICSLIVTALFAVGFEQFFDDNDMSDEDQANYQDPNEDLIEEQKQYVEEHPDDFEAVLLLANLLGNTGRLNEAIPWYEKALQMRPDDVPARLDFARALSDGGLTSDAELQFKKLLELDPDNQSGHYYLGELYRQSKPPRTEEAIAEYRVVLEIDQSTVIAQQAREALIGLGVEVPATPGATPGSGTPPVASPPGDGTGGT